ncbi:MAG: phosphatidylglycerol lysyltransferase domain-containing protein, partial [Oscillospiraceae bacterium]|nr:phosphatidylglycerol lysyltransferase domain-containing protein [Oscillospiraceae bacterium]
MIKCKESHSINDELEIKKFSSKINNKIKSSESCLKCLEKPKSNESIVDNFKSKESSEISINALCFEELNSKNVEEYKILSQKCPYLSACYSAGQLLMWKDFYNASIGLISGCVIVKVTINKKEQFLYPYAYEENADINAALTSIEKYAAKNYIPLMFFAVPRSELSFITARYTNASFSVNRNASDYIYLSSDLQNFVGKKYSGQRNHINKFKKLYPNAVFREVNDQDFENKKLEKFWEKFENGFNKSQLVAKIELNNSKT